MYVRFSGDSVKSCETISYKYIWLHEEFIIFSYWGMLS